MEKLDIIEKQENEIYEKDCRIEELETELEEIKNINKNKWQHHILFEDVELIKDLPVPRIQMNFETDGYNNKWVYGLVIKPFWFQWDGLENKLLMIPISRTTGTGKRSPSEEDKLPFRDGLHVKYDAKELNLPAYFVWESEGIVEKIKEYKSKINE
jgi:hypothetical protein